MTELERYKKAYATLVGQVDQVIANLEAASRTVTQENAALALAMGALIGALQEAEDIIIADD